MERIFEQENPYLKVGFLRNPFKMELELESIKQIAFQREANRVYVKVDENPQKTFVIWVDPEALIEDEIDFYSFLLRSFLLCPESKYFIFDVLGHALRVRANLSGFEAVTSQIYEGNAGRIFYSYAYNKLRQANEEGGLKDRLPSFDDVDGFLEEVKKTRGKALADVLFYQPEEHTEEKTETAETEGGTVTQAVEEKKQEAEVQTEAQKEEDLRLKQKEELASFLIDLINADNIGEASKTAMRTTVMSGLEIGMTSFLPRDPRNDLLGILRLLSHAYSRLVCFMCGVGDIPFLEEDEVAEYTALIAEQEMLIRRSANVCYVLKKRDEIVVRDLIEGKESLQMSFFPEVLKKDEFSKEDFRDVTLYLTGAFKNISSDFIADVEEAAYEAYKLSDGNFKDGLKTLERAFDYYAYGKGSLLEGVKRAWG